MRTKLIAGNWKMNGLKADATTLAKAVFEKFDGIQNLPFEVLVCPPMNVLGYVADIPHKSVFVGAQDVAETVKPNGAFTGDISAAMVKDLGATWTLVGHSERRTYHHETDAIVRQKAENAINNGLTVVICIGETLEERESGKALEVVTRQVRDSRLPKCQVLPLQPIVCWLMSLCGQSERAKFQQQLMLLKCMQPFGLKLLRI